MVRARICLMVIYIVYILGCSIDDCGNYRKYEAPKIHEIISEYKSENVSENGTLEFGAKDVIAATVRCYGCVSTAYKTPEMIIKAPNLSFTGPIKNKLQLARANLTEEHTFCIIDDKQNVCSNGGLQNGRLYR